MALVSILALENKDVESGSNVDFYEANEQKDWSQRTLSSRCGGALTGGCVVGGLGLPCLSASLFNSGELQFCRGTCVIPQGVSQLDDGSCEFVGESKARERGSMTTAQGYPDIDWDKILEGPPMLSNESERGMQWREGMHDQLGHVVVGVLFSEMNFLRSRAPASLNPRLG